MPNESLLHSKDSFTFSSSAAVELLVILSYFPVFRPPYSYIADLRFYSVFLQGLELPEIIVESEKRGISFDKLLTVPEQDDWLYTDGYSTSCIAFVLQIYKKAGLFDPITNSIQVAEFTVSFEKVKYHKIEKN